MNIAILSDIHGNLEAFTRCLQDIEGLGVDRIVNLGDAIGYGPQPEEVLNLLEKLNIATLLGNHELAAISSNYRDELAPPARQSLEHTINYLSPASLEYLRSLPLFLTMEGALMVHGCPPDSPTIYSNHLNISELHEIFTTNQFKTAFVGHSHHLLLISNNGSDLAIDPIRQETLILDPEYRHIVNVGAIGQPRDGNPLAKYVIWNSEEKTLRVRMVAYDIDHTIAMIGARGFFERDAARLRCEKRRLQGRIFEIGETS